jgi:3-dehydroquinate synthase
LFIKKDYIESDEFDAGKRNFLNYGHCFGHALENTSNFKIPHGQAVLVGIAIANIVSRRQGVLSKELESQILKELLIPTIIKEPDKTALIFRKIVVAMRKDKKRVGEDLPLVMLENGFQLVKTNHFKEKELKEAIKELVQVLYN